MSNAARYLLRYKNLTGAQIIAEKLREHDVRVVTGYSGGANLPPLDQFHAENNNDGCAENTSQHNNHGNRGAACIGWITNSSEQNTDHVAVGYAKVAPGCTSARNFLTVRWRNQPGRDWCTHGPVCGACKDMHPTEASLRSGRVTCGECGSLAVAWSEIQLPPPESTACPEPPCIVHLSGQTTLVETGPGDPHPPSPESDGTLSVLEADMA